MKTYLMPYSAASQGCKNFSEALGIKRIKRDRSLFKGNATKTVINWGCATVPPEILKCNLINHPDAINKAGNKLLTFEEFEGYNGNNEVHIQERMHEYVTDFISHPEYTTDKAVAAEWDICVARTVLRGHSGAGIVVSEKGEDIVDAPLYVKYIKKTDEYRLHVLNGNVFDVQRKMRNKDVEDADVNWKVRNHDNGFIFGREGVDVQDLGKEQAILAVKALGLHFGAVDLIYNKKEDMYYVIEVNTAPGLTGTTLDKYAEAFDEL